MTSFVWHIDSENYLNNNSPHADKMSTKHFIDKICRCLDNYSKKYSLEQLKNGVIPHSHSCSNLRTKSGRAAKQLYGHLKRINENLANEQTQIDANDIYQLKIKGIVEKQEYRCFGYILPDDDVFHLVYLDPDHEVYE
ncbi:MAG: hypothetical protein LBC64_11080 [Fibromonadaceae bacterium]|jgi:hypothetical protein|nr:hypothetical protein [Fibromonadaceae bacterium]